MSLIPSWVWVCWKCVLERIELRKRNRARRHSLSNVAFAVLLLRRRKAVFFVWPPLLLLLLLSLWLPALSDWRLMHLCYLIIIILLLLFLLSHPRASQQPCVTLCIVMPLKSEIMPPGNVTKDPFHPRPASNTSQGVCRRRLCPAGRWWLLTLQWLLHENFAFYPEEEISPPHRKPLALYRLVGFSQACFACKQK